MKKHEFESFNPTQAIPLVVSFITFALSLGYSSIVPFNFWDFYVLDKDSKLNVALKTIKTKVTGRLLKTILVEKAPFKIVFIERPKLVPEIMDKHGMFMATTGAGLYARDVGWLLLPGQPNVPVVRDLGLKLAPRWRKDSERGWVKTCTSCGKECGPEDFYKSAYSNARDPYRNICISCFREGGKK